MPVSILYDESGFFGNTIVSGRGNPFLTVSGLEWANLLSHLLQ